jgi:hypothetical protein
MRAAIFNGPGAVEAGERPDPVIQEPTDAVVRGAGLRMRVGPVVLPGRVAARGWLDWP